MKRNGVRFNWRLAIWFCSIFGVLFLSGVLWLAVRYYNASNEGFNSTYSSFEPWLLRIHGAAAMGSLVILGVLIPWHMRRAWAQRRNRVTAVCMVVSCILLVASGYGLYYCGDENLRSFLSGFHSSAGCALPLILTWHILSGRRRESRTRY